jgi:hypothetical protein
MVTARCVPGLGYAIYHVTTRARFGQITVNQDAARISGAIGISQRGNRVTPSRTRVGNLYTFSKPATSD